MSKKADLTDYRTNGEYEAKNYRWRRDNNFLPHECWRSKKEGVGHNRGLLVSRKTNKHWSVGIGAIQRTARAQDEGVIERGYLVLQAGDDVISIFTINQVLDAIEDENPNSGTSGWGDYFFFDENLKVVEKGDFNNGDDF